MKNNQNGITLVALVITIIVLLILAGVTIAALSGENGILNRGSQSKVQTNIANAKDLINLGVQECLTDYYNGKYVDSPATVSGAIVDYINANIDNTQAKSVISSKTPTTGVKLVIATNVKDANDQVLTAELDVNGKITWTNDAMTKTP